MVRSQQHKGWLGFVSVGAALALAHCSLLPGAVRVPMGSVASTSGASASSSASSNNASSSTSSAQTAPSASASGSSSARASTQSTPAAPQAPQRFQGALTVVNRSGVALCDLQVIDRGSQAAADRHADGPIAPGAEVTVRVSRNVDSLMASACDATRSLLGRPTEHNLSELTASRVVIQDANGTEQTNATQLVITVNPTEPTQWIEHALQTELRSLPPNLMRDAALERTLTAVMVDHARAERWSETFEAARLASVEFDVVRGRFSGVPELRKVNALVGARWPDGHCTMQAFLFSQQHNGARFTGPWQHAGTGGQFTVPCSVLRSMQPRAAR